MERPLIVGRMVEVLDLAEAMVRAADTEARVNAPSSERHGELYWPRPFVRGAERDRPGVLAYITAASPPRALELIAAARRIVAIHEAPPAKGGGCGTCREEFPCCTILAIAQVLLGYEELADLLGGDVEAFRLATIVDATRLPIVAPPVDRAKEAALLADAVATIVEATTGTPEAAP